MNDSRIIDEISMKIRELIKNSPIEDMERNLDALLRGMFSRLDLVTREEFDAQAQVLARTRAQLDAMERRLAALETPAADHPSS